MLDNSQDEGGARSDDNDYDTGGARSDDSDNNDEDDDEQHEVLSTTTTTKMMNEMGTKRVQPTVRSEEGAGRGTESASTQYNAKWGL
jgi:hypothetical protein